MDLAVGGIDDDPHDRKRTACGRRGQPGALHVDRDRARGREAPARVSDYQAPRRGDHSDAAPRTSADELIGEQLRPRRPITPPSGSRSSLATTDSPGLKVSSSAPEAHDRERPHGGGREPRKRLFGATRSHPGAHDVDRTARGAHGKALDRERRGNQQSRSGFVVHWASS